MSFPAQVLAVAGWRRQQRLNWRFRPGSMAQAAAAAERAAAPAAAARAAARVAAAVVEPLAAALEALAAGLALAARRRLTFKGAS